MKRQLGPGIRRDHDCQSPDANAVVYCVEGVYRAGCVARQFVDPTVRGVARADRIAR